MSPKIDFHALQSNDQKCLATGHFFAERGVDWQTVWTWFTDVGLPLLLKIITALGGSTATGTALITWVNAAIAAEKAGQPMPPLP